MLRRPAANLLRTITFRAATTELRDLFLVISDPPASSSPVFPKCLSTYRPIQKAPPKDHHRQDPPVVCRIYQVFRNKQVHLNVTGRTAKDYILNKECRHVSENPQDSRVQLSFPEFWYRRFTRQLQATFLPAGYPNTVGPNYVEFAVWQAVTNFATTANSVLASTFLLYSVGLGTGSIPTAGALNWVLKDGLGQLGTLLFGKAIAHNFDIHSKSWYFLSIVMLTAATGLEIMTLLWPPLFLVMGSLANMIKGLSWMAGGSTRSVFNLSFVRDNNIADITAKGTSQYIFASVLGTAAGVSMCAYIGQTAHMAGICFATLSAITIFSAFKTVKSIPLASLNSTRLQLLAEKYLECVYTLPGAESLDAQYVNHQSEYVELDESACELELPDPVVLAVTDPPLPWVMGDQRILNPSILVGEKLDKVMGGRAPILVMLLTTFKYSKYLLLPGTSALHLTLHQDAGSKEILQAYLQACMLRKRLRSGEKINNDNVAEVRIIMHETLLAAEKLVGGFMVALERRGWCTGKVVVEASKARAHW